MSSVDVGNKLESQIYDLFNADIQADRFIAPADRCKIYRQRGYYSKDRDSEIVFDVAIELFLPDAETYSSLWLLECKNYGGPVPVGDVEQFFAKMQQVAPANAKGVVISAGGFQSGALAYAKSKGIGLIRYTHPSYKWVLRRTRGLFGPYGETLFPARIETALAALTSLPGELPFYCLTTEGEYTNSLSAFFHGGLRAVLPAAALGRLVQEPASTGPLVPFVRPEELELRCQGVLTQIGYTGGTVSLENICEWQGKEMGLVVRRELAPAAHDLWQVLGRIQFEPLEIVIYTRPDLPEAVSRFTLAHELAHLLLGHGEFLTTEYSDTWDLEGVRPNDEDIARLEWQANQTASSLLMPTAQVLEDITGLAAELDLKDKGYGLLYLDQQSANQRNWNVAVSRLKLKYAVSASVVYYRLKGLGILNDGRDAPAPIRVLLPR